MHALLKVAICVELLIVGLHGFSDAEGSARLYPFGATALIDIRAVPQVDDVGERFVAASERESVPLGRIRYSTTPSGTVQTIALTPSAVGVIAQKDRERVFGFTTPVTTTTVFGSGDEVVGRWVSFGTEAQTAALVTRLTDEGFTVEALTESDALRSSSLLENLPSRVIEVAGLLAVFVAGIVSSARATRVRAIRQLFGARAARTVAQEAGVTVGFTAIAGFVALVVWGVAAVVGWGGRDSFTGPGLFVVIPIIIAAVCCAVMCVAASGIAASVVRRITDQVAGKRPLRLIQVVSTGVFIMVIIGAFMGIERMAESTQKLNGALHVQNLWQSEPEARAVSIRGVSDEFVDERLPNWARMVRQFASENLILLSYLQDQCSTAYAGQCFFVDRGYLDRTPIRAADGTRISPTGALAKAYLPPSFTGENSEINKDIAELLIFLRGRLSGEAGSGSSTLPPGAVAEPGVLAPDQTLPVYSSRYRPGEETVTDPLLIVLDDEAYAGDISLDASSSGMLIFFTPSDTLERAVDRAGIRPLVFSIDRPANLAASEAIQARAALLREGIILASGLIIAFALLFLLSAAYVERQRKPLFLSYLHGQSFLRRYAGYLTFLTAIVTLGVLLSVGIRMSPHIESLSGRAALGVVFVLATIPLLATNERRFRADFLKHP
ncbi:MAG: hypothetical protein B5766_08855 [Candidatus Lumbricidophila eiseniae]|uniref:DUF1430 domain-containing protein n=1 Tax=Candidatus Lumbricidiphila eiseniae TaxID=1969409 RepID=A0A2A6FQH0_9MICO|nr:MAG: hypothetical protein B5766_08855 [Candidatus Lumbricidophila eiseniae]